MNQDDIIRMAGQAGFSGHERGAFMSDLVRFAALVAAAEREACAQECKLPVLPDDRVLAVPLLTKDEIKAEIASRANLYDEPTRSAFFLGACWGGQLVRSKLDAGVPMTNEQRYSEFCNWYANAECQMTPSAIFDEAFRRAEEAHGIVGKEGGNV